VKLSVLDLIPTRGDQTTAGALEASAVLARAADDLGFVRYWVAEHHNMAPVASTVPAVIIPFLAQGTSRIRFGSGGVMLPNHSALAVAEQFALLEAMFPGRIDLGIGRAPGSDQVTAFLLRGAVADVEETFPRDVALIAQLLGVDGEQRDAIDVQVGGGPYQLRATPRMDGPPELWLLGSSAYSAQLAATMGLPYAFAHHFGMPGLEDALALYRTRFTPGPYGDAPRTLLPVNVVVDPDPEIARRRALPQMVQMTQLRTTGRVGPQLTVEQAEQFDWTEQRRAVAQQVSRRWLVGTPQEVATGLRELSEEHEVEELMLAPASGSFAAETDPATGPRVTTLRLLAEQLPAQSDGVLAQHR
jgi:luciferase family oxidoreductase group 1